MDTNLTLTNATQIAQQFRHLSSEEIKFIEKLLASKDLWHKSTEELIEISTIFGSSSISGIGGGAAIGAGLGSPGGPPGMAIGAAIGAGIAGVFTLIGVAIVADHFSSVKKSNDKEYQERLDIEASKAKNNIVDDCLKEEWNNIFQAREANILENTFKLNEKHDLFNSWFSIRDMAFLERELNGQEKQQKEEYVKHILQYIKPEKLLDFQNDMRRYCAAKGIGEFSNTLPKWHDNKWYQREKRKNEIISQCFKDPKDESGNRQKFDEITTKFYGTYKAILFLIKSSQDSEISIDPKEIKKYSDDLEKFIAERVDSKTRRTFDKKFTHYRYLGGRCEFDRNNIFEMEEFDKYYSSDESFRIIKDDPMYLVAAIIMNFLTIGAYAPIIAGQLTGIVKPEDLRNDYADALIYVTMAQ